MSRAVPGETIRKAQQINTFFRIAGRCCTHQIANLPQPNLISIHPLERFLDPLGKLFERLQQILERPLFSPRVARRRFVHLGVGHEADDAKQCRLTARPHDDATIVADDHGCHWILDVVHDGSDFWDMLDALDGNLQEKASGDDLHVTCRHQLALTIRR